MNTRLPGSGPGYVTHRFVVSDGQFGLPETVQALQAIGRSWADAHPGAELSIGDISLESGGRMPGHETHRRGLNVDIWPVNAQGTSRHVPYTHPTYSRARTQQLVDAIHDNGKLEVAFILFNDRGVSKVRPWRKHDEHLHVEFRAPYPLRRLQRFAES